MKVFEFNENTPLPLATLWVLIGIGFGALGALLGLVNPILIGLGLPLAMAGGLFLAHGIVPLGWAVFNLLAKGVDRFLSFAFDL